MHDGDDALGLLVVPPVQDVHIGPTCGASCTICTCMTYLCYLLNKIYVYGLLAVPPVQDIRVGPYTYCGASCTRYTCRAYLWCFPYQVKLQL